MSPVKTMTRRTDPATSHLAAARVDRVDHRRRILMVLGALTHGLTAEELEKILATRASPSSVRGRLHELAEEGLVEVAGKKQNSRGILARTWKLKENRKC